MIMGGIERCFFVGFVLFCFSGEFSMCWVDVWRFTYCMEMWRSSLKS